MSGEGKRSIDGREKHERSFYSPPRKETRASFFHARYHAASNVASVP